MNNSELENNLNQLKKDLEEKKLQHGKEINDIANKLRKFENVLKAKKKDEEIEHCLKKHVNAVKKEQEESDMIYLIIQGLDYEDGSTWDGDSIPRRPFKTYEEAIKEYKNLMKQHGNQNYKSFSDHPSTSKKGFFLLVRSEVDHGCYGMFYELYAIKVPK